MKATEVERLRIDFKARYHNFQLLLTANNRALEIMAEIDEALLGTRTFGMHFVRSRCTQVTTSVLAVIRHLDGLAQGSYAGLQERFYEIQGRIRESLEPGSRPELGPMVLPLSGVGSGQAAHVGAKMARLGELRNRIGLNVPDGFVITSSACRRFMEHSGLQAEIDRQVQATETESMDSLYNLSAGIQQLILGAEMPKDLAEAIRDAYRNLGATPGAPVPLAMRSSALGEDIAGTSSAGQYRSELNVSGDSILEAYRGILAGKYGLAAMRYRLQHGIRDEDVDMCVGCIRMVDAEAGGVVYTRNPLHTEDETMFVSSAWGLPKSVVDGSTPVDLFVLSHEDPPAVLQREIPEKTQMVVCYPEEGVCRTNLTGDRVREPSLTEDQLHELARIGRTLEHHYREPLDIEWAVGKEGTVYVLQCRPLPAVGPQHSVRVRKTGEPSPGRTLLSGGVTASPGAAAGPVFRVERDADTLMFPEGAILVTAQALPRWAPLLGRAVGLVTGQGSMAGHLASVAREFGVPALLGLPGAMAALEEGSEITLDADGRRILEGREQALLESVSPPLNLMEGSPVHQALRAAARHITPLNLLDPDAPEFRPLRCRTYHDITRFSHEKAVQEMFRFGRDHRFPERSSKQLFCDVPMQWWVLNLDDGFREEVEGRYVGIDNIVSIPMLALWQGITAFPWKGPPAIDGRGFLSVMYRATTNTALNTGVRTRYSNRNYFMISKHYCSLSSRLGFHFSTVEALIGERPRENYARFQFKGGAADQKRRLKRIHFLREMLEAYGFRVEIREDSLIARIEGYEMEHMKVNLKILGYLTIHTRQLDMIMTNEESVHFYRSRIRDEIDALL